MAQEQARAIAQREAIALAVSKATQEVEQKAAEKARQAKLALETQLADVSRVLMNLETARLEAERRAAEEAAQRALEEANKEAEKAKQETEEKYAKLIEMYKKELKSYRDRDDGQAPQYHRSPHPLRTTAFISGDNRRVEVHEYSNTNLDPLSVVRRSHSIIAASDNPDFDFITQSRPKRSMNSDISINNLFHGSVRSLNSEEDTTSSQQKVIMLLSNQVRDSASTLEMQACLDDCGMTVQFNAAIDRNSLMFPSDYAEQNMMSGTMFWEPPVLSSSSELLQNLKAQGWRPLYVRRSGESLHPSTVSLARYS